jgi:hypothetical protein
MATTSRKGARMARPVLLRRELCGERPAQRRAAIILALSVVSVCLLIAGVAARLALAQAPVTPPLTTEHLTAAAGLSGQAGTIDIQGDCRPASGRPTISYTATGPATGPYPGTYRETGTATLSQITFINLGVPLVAFTAQFAIDSPVGRVTGTKQLNPAGFHHGICNTDTSLGFPVGINQFQASATYTAVITTTAGTCTSQGSADSPVAEQDAPGHPNVDFHRFDEFFTSGTPLVCMAAPAGPTSKAQCKKGGWRRFTNPSFKNQGQCIKFVNHHASKSGTGKDDGKKKVGRKK